LWTILLDFKGILKPKKGIVRNLNLNLTKLGFIRKFRPQRFHKIDPRYSASLLKQMIDSISPFVTQILVNGKQVTPDILPWGCQGFESLSGFFSLFSLYCCCLKLENVEIVCKYLMKLDVFFVAKTFPDM
jgi:hypothetical protein